MNLLEATQDWGLRLGCDFMRCRNRASKIASEKASCWGESRTGNTEGGKRWHCRRTGIARIELWENSETDRKRGTVRLGYLKIPHLGGAVEDAIKTTEPNVQRTSSKSASLLICQTLSYRWILVIQADKIRIPHVRIMLCAQFMSNIMKQDLQGPAFNALSDSTSQRSHPRRNPGTISSE
jgi:hypothetical protein